MIRLCQQQTEQNMLSEGVFMNSMTNIQVRVKTRELSSNGIIRYFQELVEDIQKNRMLYLFLAPCIIYFFIFWVIPLYGVQIAFKDFNPVKGIGGSPWIGLKYFKNFFSYYLIKRLFINTIGISLLKIIFGFSVPIILAIMINEIKRALFKRVVQTISYLPHFISWVIIASIVYRLFAVEGIINDVFVALFGAERQVFMVNPKMFWPLLVATDIWKEAGFGAIIYMASIAGIDQQQYEVAKIDGAGRLRQIFHITLPGIASTCIILFILRVGQIMQAGFDQIWTLRNGAVAEVTDVLDVYTMIVGIQQGQYGYGAAVGLFTGIVNLIFVIAANYLAHKKTDTSLW